MSCNRERQWGRRRREEPLPWLPGPEAQGGACVAEGLSAGSRRGCSDLLLGGSAHSLEGWEWRALELSSWADGIILPKIQAQGQRGRRGRRYRTEGDDKEPEEALPSSSRNVSFLFLPPRESLGHQLECRLVWW